jgi:hypothetical protein
MRSTPGHAKVVLPLEEEEEEERGGRSNFLSLPPHPKKIETKKKIVIKVDPVSFLFFLPTAL